MGRVYGFTLLEVLVALLIVSLALSGLVAVGGQSVASSAHLRAKTIATLVASNRLAEVELLQSGLATTETFGEAAMAGQNWRWRQRVGGIGVGQLKRIDVAVFEPALSTQSASSTPLEGASPLVTLSALVRPARRNAR